MDRAAMQRDADKAAPPGGCCPQDRLPHSAPLWGLPPYQKVLDEHTPLAFFLLPKPSISTGCLLRSNRMTAILPMA